MDIYPAIDLRGGRCVRLLKGDYDQETRYELDPVELAKRYQDQGAACLHLVDLDGARDGQFTNLAVIEQIGNALNIPIQCGGGIRTEADLQRLFSAGISRVVIGSLAVKQMDQVKSWLEVYGAERICLALDVKPADDGEYRLTSSGWTEDHGMTLSQGIAIYLEAGLKHVLCTDISRDGTLTGTNVALYRQCTAVFPELCFQASGGVSDLNSIVELTDTGVTGVVVGKALLDGRFELTEALACLRAA